MSLFQAILKDLRDKRLWPVAVALIAAIVAVPIVLAKSPSAPPPKVPPAGGQGGPGASAAGLPVISVQTTTTAQGALKGQERDPFTQVATTSTTTSTSAATTSPAGGSATRSTGSGTGGSGATGIPGVPGGGSTIAPMPPTSLPTGQQTPPPSGLTPTQSYDVAVSITNADGGFDTVDPVVRLGTLPGDEQPLLIQLGVLKGGHRVLFAVQPGTIVSGPGTCTPGPIECQILSLAEDQTEQLSKQSPNGPVPVGLFAVTGISINQHSSVAAAEKARQAESAVGRDLINKSPLSALSLFRYDVNQGVVVDLRNLKVGGN